MDMTQIVLLIGIILVLYIIAVNVVTQNTINEYEHSEKFKSEYTNKPYIWVYWELINGATKPPDYIELCIDIIKKNGSKYFNVVLLNEKNIFEYLPDLRSDINKLPIPLKTDYIRIKLLYTYGGLWMDADTIMMTDLKMIASSLNYRTDFVSFGCTGAVCKNNEGYGRPSNGVMGSKKHGRLIKRCLIALDKKLDNYYKLPENRRKEFDYFELGKLIIWKEYDNLMKEDPKYRLYHVPSYADGTRDINGRWIAKDVIFKKKLQYAYPDRLQVIMLANSQYCGKDPAYNWFCKLKREEIVNGDYFLSHLFRRAMSY